ncbi:olfactory receptor 5P56-like [Pseudophryne corroboree]|uniref:olfactory receptor 5P56-like n=1 Tax=Pseudophryne corroboree TaxID=495146 RepID=UPI003081232A
MATNILPNLLHIVLHDGGTMSLAACITQFFVFAISESSECLILMVMSYDRYLAICNPLRYNTIVSKELCGISAILAWSLSVFLMGLHVVHICKLDFCGPSFIDHFFCDFPPILKLSCSDTSLIFIQGALFGIIIITFPFTMIIVSYVYIITTILNIRSNSGRQKAFSTCSSHLTVVCIFFGTLISVYVIPTKGHLLATSKILSLLYTVAIPLLNPFIYSMRNKDFKRAFVKWKVPHGFYMEKRTDPRVNIGLDHVMHGNNISSVFLLGFPNLNSFNFLLFLFLLIIYCVTMCGNVIIIVLVSMSRNLHSPMYFFITQVSVLDILMVTDILPNLLHIVLYKGATMSLGACISQFYVFANTESSECLILTVMSYDRYLAICNPLRYNSIINQVFCVKSVMASWSLSFLLLLKNEINICKFDFCGPNVIDHFFCDLPPILEISCSDTSFFRFQATFFGIILIMCPFTMIIVSYVYIITTILNIRSISGRQKAFSTCSSHLTVVCIFFGTLLSVYMVPAKGHLLATSKALSLLYTVVTPMVNPFVYSLRNKDFKETFEKCKHNFI